LIASYRAYSKFLLRKYESAKEQFEILIDLMSQGGYTPECLFIVHWQRASCYYGMGKVDKCKKCLKELVNSKIAPTLEQLQARNFMINRQPCFHLHELISTDKMVINAIVSEVLGQNIIAFQHQGELVPSNCICSIGKFMQKGENGNSGCESACIRLGGYAAIAVTFIPNKTVAASALAALVEFQINCQICCEKGWGSDKCCSTLKWIIITTLNMDPLDGL
jgi:hypothetical protein